MIIDAHHHMVPRSINERVLQIQAEYFSTVRGRAARSERIDISTEEVKRRLASHGPDPDGEKLLERMARAGIDITILNVTDNVARGRSDEEMLELNKRCADIAIKSRGKIVPLAGVDPRRKKAPELFRRCIEEYGMKGLKWHPDMGYYPNSEEAYAVLKVVEELGMPLLTHTGPLPPDPEQRMKFAHPLLLDDVVSDFPGINVVAAHMGRFLWRDWATMAQFRPNLYGDLAMWQTFALTSYERFCRDLREILDIAGTDSVLFGSDGPGLTVLVPNEQFIQLIRDLPYKAPPGIRFTEEEVAAILGGNARKAYKL